MCTVETLEDLMTQVALQPEDAGAVLSGYLNRDEEGRAYFEQKLRKLRQEVNEAQRGAFDEAAGAARQLWKRWMSEGTALAFFVRGGQRMFLRQAPLAIRVANRLTYGPLPALYDLGEIRDNLDRFNLLHIGAKQVHLSHLELGRVQYEFGFRAGYRAENWGPALLECMKRFADRQLKQPGVNWIIAASEDVAAETQQRLRRPVDVMTVDPEADVRQVQQQALGFFEQLEEMQSRRIAAGLVRRGVLGYGVKLGAKEVLRALSEARPKSVVLSARRPRDLALSWLQRDEELKTFHDRAVWLARRAGAHVEIVKESAELQEVGGSACC